MQNGKQECLIKHRCSKELKYTGYLNKTLGEQEGGSKCDEWKQHLGDEKMLNKRRELSPYQNKSS